MPRVIRAMTRPPWPAHRAAVSENRLSITYAPGILPTAHAFLLGNPSPTQAEIREALAGNLCPRTGYHFIVEAIAEGSVVQRRWISRLTGLERSVETLVTMANGGIWRDSHGALQRMPTLEDDGTELRERRFLPYRR